MSNRVKKYAAMIRIQMESRMETIVTFICTPDRTIRDNVDSWNELVDLIHDPASYMKAQQYLWDQDEINPFVEWELLRPATMSLQCGTQNDRLARKTSSALCDDPDIAALSGYDTKNNEHSYAETLGRLINGSFHVEFATYTNFISVTYYPPLAKLTLTTPWSYGNREISSPKLLYTSGDTQSGSVHVDIDSTPRGRALFFASLAHSPDWLYKNFNKIPFEQQNADLRSIPAEANRSIGGISRLTTNFEFKDPDPRPIFASSQSRVVVPWPDIIITNLSDAASACPGCLQGNWVRRNGQLIFVESATGVSYKSASMTREILPKPELKPKPNPKPPAKKAR
jgi:hypothetical protein